MLSSKKCYNFLVQYVLTERDIRFTCKGVFAFNQKGEPYIMKIKMLPQEERPVEKAVFSGVASLTNTELLAVLLGSGTREKSAIGLAEDILSAGEGGVTFLADCAPCELTKINGVGNMKAVRVLAGIELGRRVAMGPINRKAAVRKGDDVANLFIKELRYEKKEKFKAVLLNAKGEVLSIETVSIGDLTTAPVHPREVFYQAIKKSAAAVVFVHNHPSGDPTPSADDIETTKRLMACGELLGIRVVDHLVIGDRDYCSIAAVLRERADAEADAETQAETE